MSTCKILILLIFLAEISYSKLSAQNKHPDSTYFRGKYYTPEELKKAKEYNFDDRFMPGLGYGYFQPSKADSIGSFHGVVVKYLIYRNVTMDETSGPSHWTIYTKFNLLNSTEENISQIFLYSLGADLSFEKDPHRYYFIPYFGLEIGGLSQKSYGTTIQFTPSAGIHLISKKNFTLDITCGYVYPIRNFEALAGWYGDVCFNFVLW